MPRSRRYARGLGANRKGFPWNTKIRLTLRDIIAGASATFHIETSPDNSVWTAYTTGWQPVLTIPTGKLLAEDRPSPSACRWWPGCGRPSCA